MADTWHGLGDSKLKLVDLGDGTYAWASAGQTALDSDTDSVTIVNEHEVSTWNEQANATNATATATHAAAVGFTHYLTAVLLSFSTATPSAPVAATIADGAGTIATFYVVQTTLLTFPRPLKMTSGNAVAVALPTGGVGVVGRVFIAGYTL